MSKGDSVSMRFVGESARGTITLVRHGWGADLLIDGKRVCFIDLFPPTEDGPPQLIIDGGPGGEPLTKVVCEENGPTVVVHKDATMGSTEHGIHHGNIDRIFTQEPQ